MSSLSPDQHPSSQLQGFYGWTDTLKGVYYGPGSFEYALPKLRTAIGGTKALIVTGRSLYHKTDIVKKVEEVLRRDGAYGGTFWEIGEHSPIADIRAGLDAFCTARADYIVAVGGGSPVDASKAILYMLRERDGGELKRQIAIPTTLSAAEYTIGAGYTNDEGHKVAISDQGLAPSGVILDAELTLATPEKLWLSTGMRAVDHAIENLYRPLVIPPIKALCRQALRDLFSYLPQSKANPTDVTIRQKLQLASWMSLWPMRLEEYSALGLSHALGHKLGAAYSIPHGFTSCLTLASVVRLKAHTASEEDKEWLSGTLFYLGEAGTGSLEQDVQKLANLIERLVKDLDLVSSLGEYSVPREDLSKIAEQALGGRTKDFPAVVTLLEGLYETTL